MFSHVGGEGGRVVGVGEQVGHVTVERGVWTRAVRWVGVGEGFRYNILMTILIILPILLNMQLEINQQLQIFGCT